VDFEMMRFSVRMGEDLMVAVRLHCIVDVLRRRQRDRGDYKRKNG
jgi:hypothetical protein